MKTPARHSPALTLLILGSLFSSGCTTPKDDSGEIEPPVVNPEHSDRAAKEILVQGGRSRDAAIHDLIAEAKTRLGDVELQYVFTGTGKNQVLRGRPVAFALWSEAKQEWCIAHIELPRPPVKWKPYGKPLVFLTLTPGIQARHVEGTGAERLMFTFSRDGEPLKVYGRKFPVFDNDLVKRKQWSAVVQTAKPIVYLPFTEDTFDPVFVSSGKAFLLATAHQAIEDLRLAKVPSTAFRGELLADVIPPQLVTTLAVIEQTDDKDYIQKQALAFDDVLSQYGLKKEEAYRYSVSRANALGPMQFTNRKGHGTYASVVKRYPAARLDPSFESGATNLLNAMKAAACLLDSNLAQMRKDIRVAYRANPEVLGIFPVAAYNGGGRNVARLYRVLTRMNIKLDELNRPGVQLEGASVNCPCVWKTVGSDTRALAIPKYNNENRWYVQKYQTIVSTFEARGAVDSVRTN
ncbi:MAG TPA: hypothetical protein VGE93_26345 [Bryobacteraceae bacterium]